MSDRERSRSPERGDPPPEKDQDYPPASGDDKAPAASQDGGSGGDAPANDNGDAPGAGSALDEVKLYVGNLDYATDEPRLREEFSQFGTVTDVFLPVERGTNRPRGFGFVTLSTRDAAEKAISKMDQAQLDGRTIRVNESRPKGERAAAGPGGAGSFNSAGKEEVKLYVGNLSFDTPESEIRRIFEEYGTVTDCFMPTDRDSGRVRGFAFVTMPSSEAETACNKVNGQEVDGRALRVNEAQPRGGGGGGGGGGGYRGGGGGGYNDGGSGYGGGYGGGRGGGYDDRGGYGGGGGRHDDRGDGGYGDRGGGGHRGGYDDRGGGGGYRGGGGGYGGGGGGYDDGYGGGRGGGGGYDRY
uniref:RRM domain-containing protein n=1 Tax=Pseudo-nitzschia australis TaxID=44445 RepID=A0A7S4AVL7_9STRA|mmetsp:Transcript_7923/g.15402  ORF Transcript_7923/g.15402 Transcript_7923/m.15402 type:complete len:355 (+) Transcript_7923:163-1227(+)